MKEFRDPYKVLQVDPEADRDVIQAAYRQLARKYHPDRAQNLPDDAARRMVEINAAWELLGDPDRREAYDRERAAAARHPRTGPQTGAQPPPRPQPGPTASAAAAGAHRPAPSRPAGSAPPQGDASWAGPPPGRPAGSALNFGRYSGWSLGEIMRVDPAYLDWLERMPIGRTYRPEIQALLRSAHRAEEPAAAQKRGLFGRR